MDNVVSIVTVKYSGTASDDLLKEIREDFEQFGAVRTRHLGGPAAGTDFFYIILTFVGLGIANGFFNKLGSDVYDSDSKDDQGILRSSARK